jgi:transketolase
LVGLRAIPNLNVIRPANAFETAFAFEKALTSKTTPTVIVLTRQDLIPSASKINDVRMGGYIIEKEDKKLDGVLLASGSEVGIAIEAKKVLLQHNVDVRVVSMPSQFEFLNQTPTYQESVLPKDSKVLAIEAGHPMSWYQFTKHVIGIDTFGASTEGMKALDLYKITVANVVETFKAL